MNSPIVFPENLPVSGKRADIEAALQSSQVVIVCGETGSGKTTQLPKICLNMGRGLKKAIGHTQPRRLAATSTAKRIAQELNTPLGETVGYKIRFQDKSQKHTSIKLMTDGILLAETQGDPLLKAYDTLIIDEAHERSLNIDFLLGFLKQLLPKRPDLKLIVTSATIDADRFARHFAGEEGKPAPVIEVSGRLYPVEIRYRPLVDPRAQTPAAAKPKAEDNDEFDEAELNAAIIDAVDELCREGSGDVLVFLPGEREIREAAEALRKHHPPGVEILPLFARLSAAEQDRVFSTGGARRIVLATNVAETSLTVPGIRYVVDAGMARIKRYSYRNKVEQLHVEKISQASANQRAGRCGRVAAGVCIRLYSEEDFQARPRFTDPEILRSSLAGVILRMKSLGLGDIEAFPFVEPPLGRAIADAHHLLTELNAVDDDGALTEVGRNLARLPMDPRVARMVLAARQHDALNELLIIASALSVQDPRERPLAAQEAADRAHKRFAHEHSDFLSYLKLWAHFEEALAHKKSNKKLQQDLREQFISPLRMREWREVHSQLLTLVGEQGWRINTTPAKEDAIHLSLLAGLLGNVGFKQEGDGFYLGARGIKFVIHPGSAVAKKGGRWIMAAELVETSRLFGRCVARIDVDWLEKIGAHLVRRSVHDPHWEKKAAQVVAYEKGTLYGLPIYTHRRIHYGRIDLKHAREIFIREGLVAGDWDSKAAFFVHNQRLIEQVQQLEHKVRRQDILVDDHLLFAFYDQHLPADVCNGEALERWYRAHAKDNSALLKLSREDLMRKDAGGITTEVYPKVTVHHGFEFSLAYHFEPGSPRDGVTMTVPLARLNQVDAARCEWLVPGMLKEKVLLLLKSLPQKTRRHCVPLPDYAAAFAERHMQPELQSKPLLEALREDMVEHTPARPLLSEFRIETLPPHQFMNFKLLDEHGRQLDMQRSLSGLRAEWSAQARASFKQSLGPSLAMLRGEPAPDEQPAPDPRGGAGDAAGGSSERPSKAQSGAMASGTAKSAPASEQICLTAWTFDALPELLEIKKGQQVFYGYPALVDKGEHCVIDVFDEPELAALEHRKGLRRLFALGLKDQLKFIEKNLPDFQKLAMLYLPLGSADDLKAQWIDLALERGCLTEPLPQDADAFDARLKEAKARIGLISQEIGRTLGAVLNEWTQTSKKLQAMQKAFPSACRDVEQQLQFLLPKRFLLDRPWAQLAHYPRYLKAAYMRLDRLRNDPAKDTERQRELDALQQPFLKAVAALKGRNDPRFSDFAWQLQELRVSLFAQELRTPMPVSVKRLQKAWEALSRS